MDTTSTLWSLLGGLLKRFLTNWGIRLLIPFLFSIFLRMMLGSILKGLFPKG